MATTNPDYERLPLFDGFLRDYQRDFIGAVRQSYRAGHRAVAGVLPTGMGKSATAVALPKDGARVIITCQADALVKQWVSTIRKLRRRAASIEQAWEKADPGDEWIVATLQSLQSNDRYKRFIGHVDLIVVDECDTHFSIAFRAMMQEFLDNGARILGLTATPYRGDKASLWGFYTDVPYCMELKTAFDLAYLVKPRVVVHRVKSINFDSLSKTKVDFKPEEIDGLLTSEQVEHDIANLVKQYHRHTHGVVRCGSVLQAKRLRDLLVDRYGLKVSCVWGEQNPEERAEEIAKFESGENTLITNCRVLGRGWDCPMVREIFNAAPTKNRATFMQGLGRGTRAWTGCLDGTKTVEERRAAIAASPKPHWVYHDLTNTSRFHSPITAIDILLAGSREIIQKVKEKTEGQEVSLDDLDEAMRAEIEAAKEMERLAREVERERRRGLVVGVTFDSHTRDLFAAPDAKSPKVRGYRFPFGKYRGRPLRDPVVPASYFRWALKEGRLNALWTAAFRQELDRREQIEQERPEPVTPW